MAADDFLRNYLSRLFPRKTIRGAHPDIIVQDDPLVEPDFRAPFTEEEKDKAMVALKKLRHSSRGAFAEVPSKKVDWPLISLAPLVDHQRKLDETDEEFRLRVKIGIDEAVNAGKPLEAMDDAEFARAFQRRLGTASIQLSGPAGMRLGQHRLHPGLTRQYLQDSIESTLAHQLKALGGGPLQPPDLKDPKRSKIGADDRHYFWSHHLRRWLCVSTSGEINSTLVNPLKWDGRIAKWPYRDPCLDGLIVNRNFDAVPYVRIEITEDAGSRLNSRDGAVEVDHLFSIDVKQLFSVIRNIQEPRGNRLNWLHKNLNCVFQGIDGPWEAPLTVDDGETLTLTWNHHNVGSLVVILG